MVRFNAIIIKINVVFILVCRHAFFLNKWDFNKAYYDFVSVR